MLYLNNNSHLSVQNLCLPLEVHNQVAHTRQAFVDLNERWRLLVNLRLNDNPHLSNCCFLDRHVLIRRTGSTWHGLNEILQSSGSSIIKDFTPVSSVGIAEAVDVILVYEDISQIDRMRQSKDHFSKMVKNVLQMFTLCNECIVVLNAVPLINPLGLKLAFVRNILGSTSEVHTIGAKTVVNIAKLCSYEQFTIDQNISELSNFDLIFSRHGDSTVTLFHRLSTLLANMFKIANQPRPPSRHFQPEKNVLVIGPPGCGKTSLVLSTARRLEFIVLKLSCGDLNLSDSNVCTKKIGETFRKAKLHVGNNEKCIILLKDIDVISEKHNGVSTSKSRLVVSKLIKEIDGVSLITNLVVIATTSKPEDVESTLRSVGRFFEDIEIPMLKEDDRREIIPKIAEVRCTSVSLDLIESIVKWTAGFVLADLILLFQEAETLLHKSKADSADEVLLCYKKAASVITPTSMRGTRGLISKNQTAFADIGGLEDVKKVLRMTVQWRMQHSEAFARLAIPPARGILLCGPPGCAKTTLVKALAHESNATFLAVSSADLYSPFVGESEKRLTKLFTQARIGTPSIIFIDEIDALIGSKDGSREHGVQERILATLLIEMDGIATNSSVLSKIENDKTLEYENNVIVIGATNKPELIDDALKRPGRFDKIICISLPDLHERIAILKTVTKTMPLSPDVNLEDIAVVTEKYSGADLRNLCNEAALLALTERGMDVCEVKSEDFSVILNRDLNKKNS